MMAPFPFWPDASWLELLALALGVPAFLLWAWDFVSATRDWRETRDRDEWLTGTLVVMIRGGIVWIMAILLVVTASAATLPEPANPQSSVTGVVLRAGLIVFLIGSLVTSIFGRYVRSEIGKG